MLSLTGYRLVLWNGATDMRLSFNGLSGLVVNEMKEDPFQYGTLYAFFNQRRTQAKLLAWEGDGFWDLLQATLPWQFWSTCL